MIRTPTKWNKQPHGSLMRKLLLRLDGVTRLPWGPGAAAFHGSQRTGQVIASSNEVTLHSSYCWRYAKRGLNSGLGLMIICLECRLLLPSLLDVCACAWHIWHRGAIVWSIGGGRRISKEGLWCFSHHRGPKTPPQGVPSNAVEGC